MLKMLKIYSNFHEGSDIVFVSLQLYLGGNNSGNCDLKKLNL